MSQLLYTAEEKKKVLEMKSGSLEDSDADPHIKMVLDCLIHSADFKNKFPDIIRTDNIFMAVGLTNERSSSSLSGRYYSIYKAIAESKSERSISMTICIIKLCIKHEFFLLKWTKALCLMLKKKQTT